jgi:hypothetical protein
LKDKGRRDHTLTSPIPGPSSGVHFRWQDGGFKGALLFFSAQRGVFTCEVRDVTNVGTGTRLNRLSVLPSNFELSFDNFRSVRKCQLIWRRDDFIGIAFQN